MNRRSFLTGCIATLAAPAIVRASSLMHVRMIGMDLAQTDDWTCEQEPLRVYEQAVLVGGEQDGRTFLLSTGTDRLRIPVMRSMMVSVYNGALVDSLPMSRPQFDELVYCDTGLRDSSFRRVFAPEGLHVFVANNELEGARYAESSKSQEVEAESECEIEARSGQDEDRYAQRGQDPDA